MEQLSSTNSTYIYAEVPKLPMHITTVTIYDPSTAPQGKVRLKDIMNLFERAVYNVPMFRQRLVEVPLGLDQPYWVEDPDFDIEYHVRHVALPKPGDWRQFYIQVARITNRPLDRNRPLWEVYVVEGVNNLDGVPAGSFAIVMRLHHAALNGEALRSLFDSLNTADPEAPPQHLPIDRPLHREVLRGNLPLLIDAAQHSFGRSIKATRVIGEALQSLKRIRDGQSSGELRELPESPKTRFNGTLSPHRAITSLSLPFTRAHQLKDAIEDTTLNELVMTLIGGGLRRYLQDKQELPETSLVGQVMMSLKESETLSPQQRQLSPANIALHSEIEDDLERFHAVHEDAVNARNYLRARGVFLTEHVADALHPIVARSLLKVQGNLSNLSLLNHVYPASPNTLISNMPGPLDTVYFCGARIVTSFGFGPCMPDIGLVHTVTSAAGQLTIGVNACRLMMPDPEYYRECIKSAWLSLDASLGSPENKKPRSRAASA